MKKGGTREKHEGTRSEQYVPPSLEVLGTLWELTAGDTLPGNDGNPFHRNTTTSR